MIVTCPACDIRYTAPDDQLGGSAGRRLRCANCGNVWLYSPEAAQIQAAIAETAASRENTASPVLSTHTTEAASASEAPALPVASGLVAERDPPLPGGAGITDIRAAASPEAVLDTAAVSLTRPSVAVELPSGTPRRRRYIVEFVLVFVVFLIGALLLGAVFERDRIAQLLPGLAPVLASLNVTESPTAGLAVKVNVSRTGDGLTIDGDISNSANTARRVPHLRITLRNDNKDDVATKEIDAPVAQLAPGAKAHFTTVFDRPNASATSVAATFAGD